MDTAGYLRRFIDYNYHLPIPRKGKYYKELFKRFNLAELLHKNYDPNQETKKLMAENYLVKNGANILNIKLH